MKQRGVFIGVFLSFILMLVPAVSAFGVNDVKDFSNDVFEGMIAIAAPVFEFLLGDYIGGVEDFSTNEVFFAKVLLLLLLVIVINLVLKKTPLFKKQAGVAFVVALIISVLGVRFMSENQLIYGILLPYGALGVAITTVLPFVIYFYFVHFSIRTGFMRRLAWAIFGVIFLVLWASRADSIGELGNWIYFLTLLAVILAMIFDKGIKRYFHYHEFAGFKHSANQRVIAGLQSEYLNLLHVDTSQAEARRNSIEDRLRRLGGSLP